MEPARHETPILPLRCGELVEVRAEHEILATLDADGALEGLPFMPEMLRLCGQRFRVHRRADKTCDTISGEIRARRMQATVHLEGVRCDGAGHGGCQAACLIFWKEAWLRRVEAAPAAPLWRRVAGPARAGPAAASRPGCTRADVENGAVLEPGHDPDTTTYSCQATRLLEASAPLGWWEPGQYLRDWLSGNVSLRVLLGSGLLRGLYHLTVRGRGYRVKVRLYDALARALGEPPWPYRHGVLPGRTPTQTLNLQPGELITVRSHEEILGTLNAGGNRGLSFSPEMARYCGGTYRVRARVERIIDERNGRVLRLRGDCIILEDVVCRSECSSRRMFCPREIYPYWREIWLRRTSPG